MMLFMLLIALTLLQVVREFSHQQVLIAVAVSQRFGGYAVGDGGREKREVTKGNCHNGY